MSVVASEPNESPMEVSDVTVRTPQPPAPVPLPAQASVRVIAPAPVSPAVPASLHVPSEPEAPPVLRDRTDTEDTRPTKRLKTSTSQEQPAVPPPRPFFGPPPPPGFTSTPNPRSAPPPSAAVLPTFRRRDPSLPPIVSISSESLIEPSPATPVAMRQLSAGAGPMEGISSPVTSGTEPAYHTPRGVAPPPRLFHGPHPISWTCAGGVCALRARPDGRNFFY
ncbi:hypothetical protein DFP72DRAFT_29761 [Ephemerocybe angulata]|uniref:Uncharacterized protein n=1 Tax=Ephemerocybe angulata TaxID=980116 RepID=A0A8H6MES1_9AGAR|nr:hypothetical protein DFP72DRAFT_29761 [Tulosesus angulatus]